MNKMLLLLTGVALCGPSFATDGVWVKVPDVGTSGVARAEWSAPGNWQSGQVADQGKATLSAADGQYVALPSSLTLTKLVGASAGHPVLIGDGMLTLDGLGENVRDLDLYSDFELVNHASEYAGFSDVQLCGEFTALSGKVPLCFGCSKFRFDRYATQAGAVRSGSLACFASTRIDMNGGSSLCFVAPESLVAPTSSVWSLTSGSSFARLAAGQVRHALPVGTAVSGVGIPNGTFLKRVFQDGTVELSGAASAAGESELTFAALTPDVTVSIKGVTAYNATGDHGIFVQKYGEGDSLRVSMDLHTTSYKAADGYANSHWTIDTEDGFLPGVLVLSQGNAVLKRIRMKTCHLELEGNMANSIFYMDGSGDRAVLSVASGKSLGVLAVSNVVGTLTKDGAGTLTAAVGMESAGGNTGRMVVAAGVFAPTGTSDDEQAFGTLELKPGATLSIPVGGMKVGTFVAGAGSVIVGSGRLVCDEVSAESLGNVSLQGGATLYCAGWEQGSLSVRLLKGDGYSYLEGGDEIVVIKTNSSVLVTGSGSAEILLVGGGGGGGAERGGGGGGGGVVHQASANLSLGCHDLTVGVGGLGAPSFLVSRKQGGNGGDTEAFGLRAYGGGGGGTRAAGGDTGHYGRDGGSGGGAGSPYFVYDETSPGGKTLDGQGHDGGNGYAVKNHTKASGGGGGGAGAAGESASGTVFGGKGGDGQWVSICGERCYAAGGGGGNGASAMTLAAGGVGGGGKGGWCGNSDDLIINGEDGEANTGSGGGGGGAYSEVRGSAGGNGGSGVIVIRYRKAQEVALPTRGCATGGSVSKRRRTIFHTFASSGTFVLSEDANVDVLLVGGGGGGGSLAGGGGGGGGVRIFTNVCLKAGSYPVTVGIGGCGSSDRDTAAGRGGDSILGIGANGAALVAYGGGAGGTDKFDPTWGGSGGGAGPRYFTEATTSLRFGAYGIVPQGFGGGASTNIAGGAGQDHWASNGGGGGGAGAAGSAARYTGTQGGGGSYGGAGGDGLTTDFTGTSVCYGGGGGGGSSRYVKATQDEQGRPCYYFAAGGLGGGGRGGAAIADGTTGTYAGRFGEAGKDGLGGGGGGAGLIGQATDVGGDGGSGLVVIRYRVKPEGMIIVVR